MDVESLAKQLILQNMTPEQQKAVLESIRQSLQKTRELKNRRLEKTLNWLFRLSKN